MPPRFSLPNSLRLTATHVGREREPLLEARDVVVEAQALVDLAAASLFKPAYGPAGGYPGLRATAPNDYLAMIVGALAGPIAEVFALGPVRPVQAECSFSLATLPPDRLAPPQRAPHVDTVDPRRFAILHYLCDPGFGGTVFYRHRATGFETLSEERKGPYLAARRQEGWAPGYVDDGEPWFERTAEVPAEYNRVIVYRSRLLHSGRILAPEALSGDPRRGRLTVNTFATFAPVG